MMRYHRVFGDWPNLRNPHTFNEHINRKKLFDRNPQLVVLADKYAVRQYVYERVGKKYLSHLYQVTDNSDEIDFAMLPDRFVIKATHGSGWNVIVPDKSAVDEKAAKEQLRYWLGQNYYERGREWGYKNIRPRLIVEEFLGKSDGGVPWDYKFFCFDGKVRFVQVDFGRYHQHTRNMYDVSWNLLQVSYQYPNSERQPSRPERLGEMIRVSELLSAGLDFVRVDLYEVGGRVYFGEMTHYPENGFGSFTPSSFDTVLGSCWTETRSDGAEMA